MMETSFPCETGDVYRPYHEKQQESRCGIHVINNALGAPFQVTVQDAMRMSKILEKKEAEFLKMKEPMPTRSFVQPGGNELDVSVVYGLLQSMGYNPEFTLGFSRSLRLSSTAVHDGSTFIINTNNHYVCFVLRKGVWWLHDSLKAHAEVTTHANLLLTLASDGVAHGPYGRHARKVIYFFNNKKA